MRWLLRWMRQVLPRDTIVATAVLADLAIEGTYLATRFWFGAADEAIFAGYRLGIQLIAVLLYGAYRVATFHPACDAGYRQWLACTPWTHRQPLPMGPLHLVPQDVVVLAAAMLLARIDDGRVLYIPTAFFSSYCAMLAMVVWTTGQKLHAYGLGAALGLVIYCVQQPSSALVASLIATTLTPFAIRASLQAFPWELPWFSDGRSWQQMMEQHKERQLGWPFDVFAPKVPQPWIARLDGIGGSLLAGWWVFAIYGQLNDGMRFAGCLVWHQVLIIAAIARVGVYLKNHRPPISMAGRIATLRLWQQGFDIVFLAPFAAVIVGNITLVLVLASAQGPAAAIGVNVLPSWTEVPIATAGVTTTLLILFLGGPSLESWRMTGRHRIVFQLTGKTTGLGSSEKNQEFVQTA